MRSSLPWLAAGLLLGACGGDDNKGSPTDVSMAGAPGTSGVACESDADCDDNIFCNGEETCDDGSCRHGDPVDCSDGIECTIDRCDEETKACQSSAPDADGDGHADANCEDESGKSLGDDCDDDDARSFPGNSEVCDADNRDEDCDPSTLGDRDADQDGYLDAQCCNEQPDGSLSCGDDCDDQKPNVNPESTEACDFLDNNCDGEIDEGVSIDMYRDADHDGRGDDDSGTVKSCAGAVGYSAVAGDCDDSDPEVFLGQFEICDGKDNNCNGEIDEVQEQAPWYKDVDGDGYGDPESTPVFSCYRVPRRVLSQNDCDDGQKTVNPNAPEICDGRDNDCNGMADFRLPGVNNFEDDDGDGAADAECGGPDCNDQDPRTAEGAEEVCDYVDNDCDGEVDEQTVQNIWYIDDDGDGWGVVIGSALASCDPLPNRASQFGDCNDSERDIRPGSTELCDGIDNDCDGLIDEGASVRCQLPNATASCSFGHCKVFSCVPGFADADMNPDNGCEAPVNPDDLLTTQPCVVDDECDDGNFCTGAETCSGGFCRLGTPINCDAGPTIIQGNVTIIDWRDIQALAGVELVTGDIEVIGSALTSLVGLESLRRIGGSLTIQDNGELLRLSGSALSNLEVVGGDIVVENNPNLVSVDLPSLASARRIQIRYNDSLQQISGYESLSTVGDRVVIADNENLQSIRGFDGVSHIGGAYNSMFSEGEPCLGGGLLVTSNASLTEFDAFESLSLVEGDVCFAQPYSDNDQHLDVLSLPNLSNVGSSVSLGGAQDVDLGSLEVVGSNFRLYGDVWAGEGTQPWVKTVNLPELTTVGGQVYVTGGSDSLETLNFPALAMAQSLNLEFYNQASALQQVDFSALSVIEYMYVQLMAPTAGVVDFGFPALTEATGGINLNVTGDGVETVLFPMLEQAGDVYMNIESSTLTRVELPLLTEVGNGLHVVATSPNLQNLDIGALTTAGYQVIVQADPTAFDIGQLTTIGLDNNGTLQLCTGQFYVCDEVARIQNAGYVGIPDTCGQCGQSL